MADLEDFQALKEGGGGADEILKMMKERDLTIIQAIKASMRVFDISLGDAKSLVSSHPSWRPTAEAARPFQDDLVKAFQEADGPGARAAGHEIESTPISHAEVVK